MGGEGRCEKGCEILTLSKAPHPSHTPSFSHILTSFPFTILKILTIIHILRGFHFIQHLFPKATEEVSQVLISAFHIHSAKALSSYHQAHKTTSLGHATTASMKALSIGSELLCKP